ncbi:MAG: hypothetical protein K8T10_19675 [Candidatus Eremiobacteraeota bacterium]|nr:hypothetical protein [Candidatus Eremiobacteraeota bacterium]
MAKGFFLNAEVIFYGELLKMKFSTIGLSESEHALMKNAQRDYEDVFINAEELVRLSYEFLISIDPERWIFVSLLYQFQKFLSLSLLSTIRRHGVQTNMMLRQTLEFGCLSIYGLFIMDPIL